jgi:NhaP-type Na+/H+ or K+/H+ antiporter
MQKKAKVVYWAACGAMIAVALAWAHMAQTAQHLGHSVLREALTQAFAGAVLGALAAWVRNWFVRRTNSN